MVRDGPTRNVEAREGAWPEQKAPREKVSNNYKKTRGIVNKVREHLTVHNSGALLYDERYDAALVGVTEGFRGKPDTAPVAVYDREILILLLAAEFASRQVEIYSGE